MPRTRYGRRPLLHSKATPRAVSAQALLDTDMPERKAILAPMLATRTLNLLYGPRGLGKTFMAMLFLLMMARLKPLISILERGDSYRPLVDLMGGRCIDVDLEVALDDDRGFWRRGIGGFRFAAGRRRRQQSANRQH